MRRLAIILSVASVLSLGAAPAGAVTTAPPSGPAEVTVTLVTGDRVTVGQGTGGGPAFRIEPARWPGRRASFATWYAEGDLRVVPSDVARLVPGTLDPELFDVSGLIRAGYDDRSATSLPLIVRRPTGLAAGPPDPLSAVDSPFQTVRALPSLGAAAVRLPKAFAAELGFRLAAPLSLAATSQVWLDARVRASDAKPTGRLDGNLTQIGAPAAWATGLSGAGVRVAVLDTGVDATHPDLAGRVVAATNLTDSPDATDHNGHGTHVAALVAGTGAAAGGARRGVAFGASLLSGKVLGDDGTGQLSTIIAGLEWAIAQRARVVNLSLSSDAPSTGQDPLSLAVDTLSAEHGVLVVASAGNAGPNPGTVGAPGAAGAALTVGAVDRRDRLAAFSSRGPRSGDFAIKPELVAPGVDISSARAAGTSLGEPVSTLYTRLSGTSMAAPQVTGAAALLAEQHPQWTPERLKAVLIGSAAPISSGVFDAGAGRLDLAAAVPQRLAGEPAALNFGFTSYPQDGLPRVDRQLTIANTAAVPSTVDLTAELRTPDGRSAPEGMLTVTPARLVVPAGGTATATVRLAVAMGGFGTFGGTIRASAAGLPSLRVPVGAVKESTRHLLHLRAVDRAGEAPPETLATIVNLTNVAASPPDPVLLLDGAATVRLEPGFYLVTSAIPTLGPGGGDDSIAADAGSVAIATVAEVAVDRDRELVLDARPAVPITARVSGRDTVPTDVQVFVATRDRSGHGFVLGYATSAQDVVEGRLFVSPTQATRHGQVELSSKWRLETVGGGSTYDLNFAGPRFPAVLNYVADPARLARIDTTYRAPLTPVTYREGRFVFTELTPVSVAIFQAVPGDAPVRRAEYVSAGSGLDWFQCATLVTAELGGIGTFCQAPADHRGGSVAQYDWLRAPLRTTVGVFRAATALQIGLNDLGDDAQNAGSIADFAFAHREYALYRNGVLIRSGTDPIGVHPVPAGPAVFRLTRIVETQRGVLALSTRVESSWTFATSPPRAGAPAVSVPVVDAAVHLLLDDRNQVPAGVSIPLTVTATDRATVSFALSTDDGANWTPVELRRNGNGTFRANVPANLLVPGALVSVRVTAADRQGNHTEQTILRAFGVA